MVKRWDFIPVMIPLPFKKKRGCQARPFHFLRCLDHSSLRFDAPASGTYMVKIGRYPARKVVVIR